MSEERGHPRRGRWPLGLIGMLALVAGIERRIVRDEAFRFTTDVVTSWRYTGRTVRREAPKAEVLCFGDSLVKFGVQPGVVGPALGRRVYNAAVYSGPPAASYFLLRRALEAGARPAALVLDCSPHFVATPPQLFAREWKALVTPREALDLALAARDAGFLADLLVGLALPSTRDRREVRRDVLDALAGVADPTGMRGRLPAAVRNWNRNAGAQAAARNPAYDGVVAPQDLSLFPPHWEVRAASARYLDRFLDLAASRGIPVLWFLPPITPASQARREELGLDARFTAYVREVQGRHANVVVVDGRRAGYPHTVYIDGAHLDHHGSTLLSADLAAILADHLGRPGRGPRWVELPAFRERPVAVALEDTDQSRAALRLR